MSLITVKKDPSLIFPEITMPLVATSSEETGIENEGNVTGTMQTKITGILYPLLSLNGFIVDFQDLEEFVLDSTKELPTVEFSFKDKNKVIENYCNPGSGGSLQVQVLPAYDGAYSKINTIFYCNSISIENGVVSGSGVYRPADLHQTQYKSFGEITTYQLCDEITSEFSLGFASNIEETSDTRFIYCNYKSYEDLLKSEIEISESTETRILEWWVDWWNYLVLCDVYERYNSEDSLEDMQIWVGDKTLDASVDGEVTAVQTDAVFNNHPSFSGSELHVSSYEIISSPYIGFYDGNSKMISVYSQESKEYVDNFVMNGDVDEESETLKFEYAGEYYGSYNYILGKSLHNFYLNKINMDTIEITLDVPQLGVMRGSQIRLLWYDNDTTNVIKRENFEEVGLDPIDDLDLGWLKEYVDANDSSLDDINPLTVNLQVSGQYTVIGLKLIFSEGSWNEVVRLARPQSNKPQIIPEE